MTIGEVFSLIRDGAVTTRTEIGRITGLSRTAVAARVAALQASGWVVERAEAPSTGGRPPARLVVDVDAGVVLAAAIGRSRTQLGVCNLAGQVLAMADVDQEIGVGPQELMPDIAKRLEALLDETGRRHDDGDRRGSEHSRDRRHGAGVQPGFAEHERMGRR